jgi:hypothetical protein
MPIVTILGSCRQTPISKYHTMTSIHDRLNYPHYTGEILQQIKYLKQKNISYDDTKYCFRSGILSGFCRGIDDVMFRSLQDEFNRTDIFLVEIATRKYYKYNGLFLHHIAEEEQYNFNDRKNIEIGDLTDEQIEEDIMNIRKEIYPKKLLIISHFATRKIGKRYQLIELLKQITTGMSIPFFDQSQLIDTYGEDIVEKEKVITNYNNLGKNLVADALHQYIGDILSECKTGIYQIYYTSEDRMKKHTFHGFGDYIRGCIYLYQYCQDQNIGLNINFSHHHLNNIFYCTNYLDHSEVSSDNVVHALGNEKIDPSITNRYFTNRFPYRNITDDCKTFIIKNCLNLRISAKKYLEDVRHKLGLDDAVGYIVVHVRLQDNIQYNDALCRRIQNEIKLIKEKDDRKMLLLMSCQQYMDRINCENMIKTGLERGHVGVAQTTHQQNLDTMIEFFLMASSEKIYQISQYQWGSGFSATANKIYGIPLDMIRI